MILAGKTAVVTGASRGIGRAISLSLARAGAKVVVNYGSNRAAAEETCHLIESESSEALPFQADVKIYKEAEKMIKFCLDSFGHLDILVNNAGVTRDNLLALMKEEEWQAVIDTNLTGVFNCCRAALRPLLKKKQGGKIINIASIAGIYGNSGQANYAASKGGVIAFTRSLAKEVGSRSITVNAVAPGFIETDMTARLDPAKIKAALERIPLGRLGTVEDVAETVLFLASKADYITGQVIGIDGGLVI
ncbi:MAG: 3-oxoacyl-[acyl-carrier-protein] reductase [Bacillota bacterium]|nr:3-oxoacyl-[acyl-carrier-protein] reductase [Bacillota bacterium]